MPSEVLVDPKYGKHTITVKGAYHGRLSPFDIPRSASSTYDAKKQELSIRFKYLTPAEPVRPVKTQGREGLSDVALILGRRSRKLYGVVITGITAQQIPDVRVEIEEAIDSAEHKLSDKRAEDLVPLLNLKTARDFLKDNEELFAFT